MYRIAHITDVHIKYDKLDPFYISFKKLLKNIKAHACDHILLTGDISDYADLRDYEIIRRLLDEFGFLHGDKLSVIPGNHDIFGGPCPYIPVYMYPTVCKNLDYKKRVYLFYNSFKETFDNATIDNESIFPFVKILWDKIAVIGINSIAEWSLEKNPQGTNGYVSNEALKKIKIFLKMPEVKDKFKIIMIHHQFNAPDHNPEQPEHALWLTIENWKMKMYDKKRLFDLIKNFEIDLVLHGHTHITEKYSKSKCLFLNASGCSSPFTKDGIKEYFIINYDNDSPVKKYSIEKVRV